MTVYEKSGGCRTRLLRAYLDTNLVSGILTRDLEGEHPSLRRLLEVRRQGLIELVTSDLTRIEIQRHGEQAKREALEDVFMLLGAIPTVEEEPLMFLRPISAQPGPRGPLPITDADLAALRTILPDEEDARHVFQAVKNGVDYFVTGDRRTILAHATEVESVVAVLVRSPTELVVELGF